MKHKIKKKGGKKKTLTLPVCTDSAWISLSFSLVCFSMSFSSSTTVTCRSNFRRPSFPAEASETWLPVTSESERTRSLSLVICLQSGKQCLNCSSSLPPVTIGCRSWFAKSQLLLCLVIHHEAGCTALSVSVQSGALKLCQNMNLCVHP